MGNVLIALVSFIAGTFWGILTTFVLIKEDEEDE